MVMQGVTVFYTDGVDDFDTSVDYNTVDEAITAVQEEVEPYGFVVLEDITREQYELDTMW